ncbi:MAG: hypothetical protein HZC51_06995 [Nitrospirae bacterium]|nr:hypothetical protein [Nitrospirota bacterium]
MTVKQRTDLLGTILRNCRIITEADVDAALEEQKSSGVRFGEALVRLGVVMQEDIDWALSHQLDIPYVRIQKESVDPDAVALVPASIARKYKLLPLIRTGDELRVAVSDPLNAEAISEAARVSGCTVSVSMGLLREILEMQDHFYGGGLDVLGFSSPHIPPGEALRINEDTTGRALIDRLLLCIAREGFTSVSLGPLGGRVRVVGRRAAGQGFEGELPLGHYGGLLATLRGMARVESEDDVSSQLVMSLSVDGGEMPFRARMLRTEGWEYVTLEPGEPGEQGQSGAPFPVDIEGLDTDASNIAALRSFSAEPDGIVVVSGPTAEARVRLMGLCLGECGRLGRDAIAVGRGFIPMTDRLTVVPAVRGADGMSEAVRAACGHPVRVIAAEELYTAADFVSAIDGALGGRLVFGGLRAPGAISALKLLASMEERFPLLGPMLRGAAACRAVRTLCPACREEHSPSDEAVRMCGGEQSVFYRAKGCHACRGTGYAGTRWLVEAAVSGGRTAGGTGGQGAALLLARLTGDGFRGIEDEARDMLYAGEISAEEFVSITTGCGGTPWQG